MVTARLEDEEGLCVWCKYQVLLYGQVVDVAGDGRGCGTLATKTG